jgi:hypothetical protein
MDASVGYLVIDTTDPHRLARSGAHCWTCKWMPSYETAESEILLATIV